jgi:hypothetical protein
MKYEARVHEDLMKSPQQLGADGNDGPREAEGMGRHAGARGGGGFCIACGSLSRMKGASPYHYPKPSATPKRGGLFMFFDFGARLRDPGGAPGRLH